MPLVHKIFLMEVHCWKERSTDLKVDLHPVHQEKEDSYNHQTRETAITDFGDQLLQKMIAPRDFLGYNRDCINSIALAN